MKRGLSKGFVIVGAVSVITLSSFGATQTNSKQIFDSKAVTDFGRRVILSGECAGRSDLPHISTHFPGTVNVVTETFCPGEKVTVKTTLSRKGWWIFRTSVTKSKSGFANVRLSVAMACKWQPGMAPIEYIVESLHTDSSGSRGITRAHSFLKC